MANVSHELKTPVGAVQLLAEASRGAADDPRPSRSSASGSSRRQAAEPFVQQIIDLSRLQGDDPLESPMTVSIESRRAAVDTSFIDAEARAIR